MEKNRYILIITASSVLYDSVNYFAHRIGQSLVKCGYNVIYDLYENKTKYIDIVEAVFYFNLLWMKGIQKEIMFSINLVFQ